MQFNKLDRRKFIHYTAALRGSFVLSSLFSHPMAQDTTNQRDLYWYQKLLRILQTVLREPDASNYDAKSVMSYMNKTGCNTLIVNGGGIVDFFQNQLPAANISKFEDYFEIHLIGSITHL